MSEVSPKTFCGAIALLGRPNVGKSTLLNALVGQKIAGVSKKPQTTRQRILGIVSDGPYQLLVLDTPGLHQTQGKARLNRTMVAQAYQGLEEACAVAYLIDSRDGVTDDDLFLLAKIRKESGLETQVFLSKTDRLGRQALRQVMADTRALLAQKGILADVYQLSSKQPASVRSFKDLMFQKLPAGPFLYPEDDLTDRSSRFVVAELIREILFRNLGQELPYHTAVMVEEFKDAPHILVIEAMIYVSRITQKGMIVGKQGCKIKEIGIAARQSLEKMYGKKVFLNLEVSVRQNWVDHKGSVAEFLELM